MRIYRHYDELPEDARGAVVAVGNFDGVHKGHQAVIDEAGTIAKASNKPWAVLSFEPHPRLLFKPDQPPFRLTPFRIKARHIEALGVDELVVQHFDKAFAGLSAEDFVQKVLVDGFGASHVVCGYDFVFGAGRKGDTETLLHAGKAEGFGFTAVPEVTDDDGVVFSSTRVRDALVAADPEQAAFVLGGPFEIEGRVEHGAARGRGIGFPTANLHLGEYLRPAIGVYAVRAGIDEGAETRWIDGVANFGNRPTFDNGDVILEVHLFDFAEDLYGRHLRVQLVHYLRGEVKFDGIEALQAQIKIDCGKAKSLLANGE